MTDIKATEYQGIDRLLAPGVLAGMLAATLMGLVVMAVAMAQRRGLLTPVYEVGALVDPDALAASIQAAEQGNPIWMEREPFVFGIGIHLVMGAILGMVFWLIGRMAHIHGRIALAAGAGYGLGVMLVMLFGVLPLIGRVLGPDSGVAAMATTAGLVTFVIAHLIFGLALGYWALRRPQDINA